MASYKTPGVYVEEISTLPPSVAEVATAIPAFIGYTERSGDNSNISMVRRITSMLEYRQHFGGPPMVAFEVKVKYITDDTTEDPNDLILESIIIPPESESDFILYYALKHYFENGGGPCYVVSVGTYKTDGGPVAKELKGEDGNRQGLRAVEQLDEPTLLVFPDATKLNSDNYGDVCSSALMQCKELGDRFTIMDMDYQGKIELGNFRGPLPSETDLLKYGAVYTPYLYTLIPYEYDEDKITVIIDKPSIGSAVKKFSTRLSSSNTNYLQVDFEGVAPSDELPRVVVASGDLSTGRLAEFDDKTVTGQLTITLPTGTPTLIEDILREWNSHGGSDTFKQLSIVRDNPSILLTGTGNSENFIEGSPIRLDTSNADNFLEITYVGSSPSPQVEVRLANTGELGISDAKIEVNNDTGTGQGDAGSFMTIIIKSEDTRFSTIQDAWLTLSDNERGGFSTFRLVTEITLSAPMKQQLSIVDTIVERPTLKQLNSAENDTTLYNQIKQTLAQKRMTLPPSSAMAGIYARVDRTNGVWKTPANVSVLGVIGPTKLITDMEQGNLNIDASSGKSINVIRSFTGKGTLVWGGRTLAGNDNEWRYISVRRLFNLIEESVQKSTSFAVFEPNDATTWLKVKAMIDSYLYGLWQQGALAGSTPEQAFFVNVGLGKTMTSQDILEGRMNVEIGLAAVRPAEFIILKFSHKLQEA